MLHLDPRIHLHEEVAEALDDALERGDAVETGGGSETLAFVLHSLQRSLVALQNEGGLPGGELRFVLEKLLRERHLEELLLVHLHRAVTTAERQAPLAVADELDLVVARRLEVELDEEVPIRAGLDDLRLREDIYDRGCDLVGIAHHALALSTAATDVLEAHAVRGVVAPDLCTDLGRRLLQLLDRDELGGP